MASEQTLTDLEFRLIDELMGRLNLLQPQKEREECVNMGLEQIFRNGEFATLRTQLSGKDERIKFIKGFLSYGIVTEILCDISAEDIIINNLKPIYMHHAHKGFISTGKSFPDSKELDLFINKLLLFSNRRHRQKLMNLELPNLEGRVNIAFSPFGPQLTITKAKVNPLSIIDLIHA